MPIKQWVADTTARFARAVFARLANDIEIAGQFESATMSARYATQHMAGARVLTSRMDVLDHAIGQRPSAGLVCEFGVFRGETLRRIATALPRLTVHGFDTFTGLPEDWRPGYEEGTFALDPATLQLPLNCKLHKGLFADTLPAFLATHEGEASLIHIDCDLYSSTACVFDLMSSRIGDGTVIVFDEFFNYPGWQDHEFRAFSEFLSRTSLEPEFVAYNRVGQQVAVRMSASSGRARKRAKHDAQLSEGTE